MKTAKELCGLLITRGLASLTEDEEDVVVDYLEDIGIEVDLDTKQQDLCLLLLDKTMEKELKTRVPITAYANSLVEKESEFREKDTKTKKMERDVREWTRKQDKLRKSLYNNYDKLPGCVSNNLLDTKARQLILKDDIGVNNYIYSAMISIPSNEYEKIVINYDNPVIEITSNTGNKAYARITYHNDQKDTVYISQLVSQLLNTGKVGLGYLKLCTSVPTITKIDFKYYGSQDMLKNDLDYLVESLPKIINSFSSLSLGMVLKTKKDNRDIFVQVSGLNGEVNEKRDVPIFVGLIPFGLTDIPFDINIA